MPPRGSTRASGVNSSLWLTVEGGSSYLLLSVDGQTCAGDGELHDKDHEEDDHVLSSLLREKNSQRSS